MLNKLNLFMIKKIKLNLKTEINKKQNLISKLVFIKLLFITITN